MPEQIGVSPPREQGNGRVEQIYTSGTAIELLKQIASNTSIEYVTSDDVFDTWLYTRTQDVTEFSITQKVNNSKILRLPKWFDRKLVRVLKISLYFDSTNSRDISIEIIKNYKGLDGYERVFSVAGSTSQSVVLEFSDSYTYPSNTLGGIKITTANGTSTDNTGIAISLSGTNVIS